MANGSYLDRHPRSLELFKTVLGKTEEPLPNKIYGLS